MKRASELVDSYIVQYETNDNKTININHTASHHHTSTDNINNNNPSLHSKSSAPLFSFPKSNTKEPHHTTNHIRQSIALLKHNIPHSNPIISVSHEDSMQSLKDFTAKLRTHRQIRGRYYENLLYEIEATLDSPRYSAENILPLLEYDTVFSSHTSKNTILEDLLFSPTSNDSVSANASIDILPNYHMNKSSSNFINNEKMDSVLEKKQDGVNGDNNISAVKGKIQAFDDSFESVIESLKKVAKDFSHDI